MTNENGQNAREACVILAIRHRMPGCRRTVDTSEVNRTDAADEALHVAKEIFDKAALRAIARGDEALVRWVKKRAIPSPILKGGFHLVPVALVPSIEERFAAEELDRGGLVDAFMGEYQNEETGLKAAAREKLGTLYREEDYPTADKLRGAFELSHGYLADETPKVLQRTNPSVAAREDREREERWRAVEERCFALLRAEALATVEYLAERLASDPDTGKPKVIQERKLDGIREWIELVRARNVTGDTELSELVGKLDNLLAGRSAKEIRTDEALREAMAARMVEIRATAGQLVKEAPVRMIALPEDEAA